MHVADCVVRSIGRSVGEAPGLALGGCLGLREVPTRCFVASSRLSLRRFASLLSMSGAALLTSSILLAAPLVGLYLLHLYQVR
jgi:hypothetical protein